MSAVVEKPVRKPKNFGVAMLTYAKAHLAQHPVEVGGPNRGPWVRLYMDGNEGEQWAWCAACHLRPPAGHRADGRADAGRRLLRLRPARRAGESEEIFLEERRAPDELRPGGLFLVRKSPTDWTHTGIVAEVHPEFFRTIEGNTNDDGVREGYEVCTLTRSLPEQGLRPAVISRRRLGRSW